MSCRDEWRRGPYAGGNQMLIIPRRRLLLYPSYVQDYLDRVTAADVAAGNTQGLELGVTDAFNTALQDLVADATLGISGGVIAQAASKTKGSCVMAGARTLAGALVPLVGPAPTNFNFVSGDYNRKTGLIGNGSTKYLSSGLAYNSIPTNNEHLSVYASTAITGNALAGGRTSPQCLSRVAVIDNLWYVDSQQVSQSLGALSATGFAGISRASSTQTSVRRGGSTSVLSVNSVTRADVSTPFGVFCGNYSDLGAVGFSSSRLAFYSIGESLTLSSLDSRVSTLLPAIAAAIP